ncbi:BTB/POZ domain-containing protein 19 isoform 1-T1 [Theristicus caerulescens]
MSYSAAASSLRPPQAGQPPACLLTACLPPASRLPPACLRRLPLLPSPRQPMAGPCSTRLQGEAAAFTAALRTLVNNPQFSDVTFVVGREQQKVFAHRCVLACRCQAFQGMLGQGLAGSEDPPGSIPPQGPFILGNVQPDVFLAVIEFLYTNSVTLNSHIALEVLTSSVEYGLQDLCKVRPCLDWGRWSPCARVLRSTPRWSLHGWGLEVALRTAPWCITWVHRRLSPSFSILEGLSGGIPLDRVQHHPGAPWGLGNPRKGHGASCLPHGKGQQESPYVITCRCPLVIWQDDAVGKAPVLGSTQHPSCGATKGVLLQAGRFWEGSREQKGGMGAQRGGTRELEQLGVGEGGQATSSERFLNYSQADRVTRHLMPGLPLPSHCAGEGPR